MILNNNNDGPGADWTIIECAIVLLGKRAGTQCTRDVPVKILAAGTEVTLRDMRTIIDRLLEFLQFAFAIFHLYSVFIKIFTVKKYTGMKV